jgi:2-polyprenyl-6-methoxyphenol hydroxylase-like FAD-dependent oxidoreductase
MFGFSKTEVLVVGAGPVGLMTAAQLAARGIAVRIVDREARTNVHSYALALHPDTLTMLDDIGLAEAVMQRALLLRKIGFYEGNTERALVEYDRLDARHPYLAVVPQSELERILEHHLSSHGVTVEWQHDLVELDAAPADEVVVVLHHTGDVPQGYPILKPQRMVIGRRKIRAKYVIGADGFHSTVRSQMHIDYPVVGPTRHFSLYEFRTEQDLGSEVRVVDHAGRFSVLWPLPDSRCRWGFAINAPADHQPDLAGLRRLASERAPWFHGFPVAVDWSACVRFDARLAESFGTGRVWLAGDAAHLTGPIGAQSMNIGFREGHDLAARIFEILRNGVPTEIMTAYGNDRLAEWRALLDPANCRPGPEATPWVRERAPRLLECLPASKGHLTNLLAQLALVWAP